MDRQKNYQKYALLSLQQPAYSLIKPEFYVLLTYFRHQKPESSGNLVNMTCTSSAYIGIMCHSLLTLMQQGQHPPDPVTSTLKRCQWTQDHQITVIAKRLPTDLNRIWWKSISKQSKSCLQMNNETRKAIKCSVESKHTRHLLLDIISVRLSPMRISLLICTHKHICICPA